MHLVVVTKGDCKSVGRIEVFRFQVDFQGFLNHHTDLFLRCCSVPADGDFGLSRGIFSHGYSLHCGCCDGCSLSPPEFQNHLGVLPVERGFDGKGSRSDGFNEFAGSGKDIGKLVERILDLAQVEYSHILVVGPLRICANNPETKKIGPGVNSEYDFFRHVLADEVKTGVWTECFRYPDLAVFVVVLKKGCNHARQGE